jgi:hypothetical protein
MKHKHWIEKALIESLIIWVIDRVSFRSDRDESASWQAEAIKQQGCDESHPCTTKNI